MLAASIAKQERKVQVQARKHGQEQAEAARRHEEEAVIFALEIELQALRGTDPGMGLLTAVEYITSDPAHRIALYRRCSAEDQSIGSARISPYLSTAPTPKGFRFRGEMKR
jgi:hypothetical protein